MVMNPRWNLYSAALLLSVASSCTQMSRSTGIPEEPTLAETSEPTVEPIATEQPGFQAPNLSTQGATLVLEPPPVDVVFPPGETGIIIEAETPFLGRHEYRVFALEGQTMTVHISSLNDDVTYAAYGVGERQVLMQNAVKRSGSYPIPATQEYAIAVVSEREHTSYTLTIEIPPLPAKGACVIATSKEFDIIPPSFIAYRVSSTNADVYTEAHYGSSFEVVLSTLDGWYGVDTGVSGEAGYSRLRWIKPSPNEVGLRGRCDLPQVLSYAALANATYAVHQMPPVDLTDGQAQLQGSEGASVRHFLLTSSVEYGDVDGDGSLEALVVLLHHTGGTGRFMELVVVANAAGQPDHIATTSLGDRTLVNDISVGEDGVIKLDLTETYSHERTPSCCGPQDVTVQFRLENGELVEIK